MSQAPNFQEARQNPALRQAYLDTLLSQCPESVKKIVYDSILKKCQAHFENIIKQGYLTEQETRYSKSLSPQSTYFAMVFAPKLLGQKKEHPVFVCDYAFKALGIEEIFQSTLIDHEGQHTDDMMHGMQITKDILSDYNNSHLLHPLTLMRLAEVRAFHNQTEKARIRGITHNLYLEHTQFLSEWARADLEEIEPKNDFEAQVKEYALYSAPKK